MWYMDLSGGVSHTGIYAALLFLIKDEEEQFISIFTRYVKNDKEFFQKILMNRNLNINPVPLFKHCNGIPDCDRQSLLKAAGDLSAILDVILTAAGVKVLSVYDMIIYFSLLILLEKMNLKKQVRFLTPKISTNSPQNVFKILQGSMIQLDPSAPLITEMCSAFIKYYTNLICAFTEGTLVSFINIHDPIQTNIQLKLFGYKNVFIEDDEFDYDIVQVLETNIDDTTPEIISGEMTEILESGALDYTIIPVMMKKGRSGFLIQVLCHIKDRDRLAEKILYQTSSFGLRMYTCLRKKLHRKIQKIKTVYGEIKIKLGYRGKEIIKASPEFDDLLTISRKKKISLFHLYNEITKDINERYKKKD